MTFQKLREEIINCRICPRLVRFRENVPIRACTTPHCGWRKPVPGFGDEKACLLIIGLAPSVEGANRTGRIFTGDASSDFLIKNLYLAKFANQPTSESSYDHLRLEGCYLTAAVKCVPPKHRPSPIERERCSHYLQKELSLLKNLKCVLVLGQIALSAYKEYLKDRGLDVRQVKFAHGARYEWKDEPSLFVSYHPSPQNTNTGVLTEKSFQKLLAECQIYTAPGLK